MGQRDGDGDGGGDGDDMTAAFSAALARRNNGGYAPPGLLAAVQQGRCVTTGDVRGGSRAARDSDGRHNAARCADPSGESHNDRYAVATKGVFPKIRTKPSLTRP